MKSGADLRRPVDWGPWSRTKGCNGGRFGVSQTPVCTQDTVLSSRKERERERERDGEREREREGEREGERERERGREKLLLIIIIIC